MLFEKNDIITCMNWKNHCDYVYEQSTGLHNVPDTGIVWTSTSHLTDLFKIIRGTHNQIIVVCSFCDYTLYLQEEHPSWKDLVLYSEILGRQHGKQIGYQGINIPSRVNISKCNINHRYALKTYGYLHETFDDIPKEIKKLYIVNNNLPLNHDPRIINICFGVQMDSEDRWVGHADFNSKRNKRYYINYVDYTLERADIKQAFRGVDYATVIEKEIPHDKFRNDLKEHQMVIATPSIGLDTFRMIEALYCGAIPIVKESPMTLGLNIPCIFYKTIDDLFNKEYIEDSYRSILEAINHEPSILDRIRFTYWEKQICEERRLLLGGYYNDDD